MLKFEKTPRIRFLKSFIALSLILTAKPSVSSINRNAPQGGNFIYNLFSGSPTHLRPTPQADYNWSEIMNWGCSHLIEVDIEKIGFQPAVAEKWEVSKDARSITFFLRKNAKFHDGTPLTAEDVKFSIEVIQIPESESAAVRPYFESIQNIEVKDPHTLTIRFKDSYYGNLNLFSQYIYIIPKHIYSIVKNLKTMTKSFICSGPYKFEQWDKGNKIVLSRFKDWFGNSAPEWKGFYNFDKITFKFYEDFTQISENAKKGNFDYCEVYPTFYDQLDVSKNQDKIKLLSVKNLKPQNLSLIGFNLRKKPLESHSVRRALNLLMNREEINRKLYHSRFTLAVGPFAPNSPYFDKSVKPFSFNPSLAKKLLAEDGWIDSDKDGVLDKQIDGVSYKLDFELVHSNKFFEPAMSYFAEELKKVGIKLRLRFLDPTQYFNFVETGKMDMWYMSWLADGIEEDPVQVYSSQAAVAGGSNYGAFKEPEIDRLMEKARYEVDQKKRWELFKRVGNMIANKYPFLFLFNNTHEYYLKSTRVKSPVDSFNYHIGFQTWWHMDAEKGQSKGSQ